MSPLSPGVDADADVVVDAADDEVERGDDLHDDGEEAGPYGVHLDEDASAVGAHVVACGKDGMGLED